MTSSKLASLAVFSILIAACGSQTAVSETQEYLSLITELESTESDYHAQDAERSDVEVAVVQKQLEIDTASASAKSTAESVTEMALTTLDLKRQLSAPIPEVADLTAEIASLTSSIRELKEGAEYRAYISDQMILAEDFRCAETVANQLSQLDMAITAKDFRDLDVEEPDLSTTLLNTDARVLGIEIATGCPEWWIDKDATFASDDQIFREVCPNVESGKLNKDPARYVGQCFTGWGEIVQFDSATGPCKFHINIGDRNTATYNYSVRSEFGWSLNDCDWLDDLVQGHEIHWRAVVTGLLTYETTNGSTNSIPEFTFFQYLSRSG